MRESPYRTEYRDRFRIEMLRGGDGAIQAHMRERDRVVEEVMEAQATLATALGLLRLRMRLVSGSSLEELCEIEDRLTDSLERSRALLGTLGSPMA